MLQDAEDYREFAGKSQIEVMDLKLAYQTRTTNAQNMPPQRMVRFSRKCPLRYDNQLTVSFILIVCCLTDAVGDGTEEK
jgi:hypothetical protein